MHLFSKALLGVLLIYSATTLAHGGAHHSASDIDEVLQNLESIRKVDESIMALRAQGILRGEEMNTRQVAELKNLLEKMWNDVAEELQEHPAPKGIKEVSAHFLGEVLSIVKEKTNPVAIFNHIVHIAHKNGGKFVLAYGLNELTELVVTLYHPWFLTVLLMPHTHVITDFMGIGFYFYVLDSGRAVSMYYRTLKRNDGLIDGPTNYYQTILGQRSYFSIDWNHTLHSQPLPDNFGFGDNPVQIIKTSWVEKFVPQSWMRFVSTQREVLRRTGMVISIAELEKIAPPFTEEEKRGIKALKKTPRVYAAYLLNRTLNDAHSSERLSQFFSRGKSPNSISSESKAQFAELAQRVREDVALVFAPYSAEEMSRRLYERKAEVDLVARQLQWELRARLNQVNGVINGHYKLRRKVQKILDQNLELMARGFVVDLDETTYIELINLARNADSMISELEHDFVMTEQFGPCQGFFSLIQTNSNK